MDAATGGASVADVDKKYVLPARQPTHAQQRPRRKPKVCCCVITYYLSVAYSVVGTMLHPSSVEGVHLLRVVSNDPDLAQLLPPLLQSLIKFQSGPNVS